MYTLLYLKWITRGLADLRRSEDGAVRLVEAIWPLGQGAGRPPGAGVLLPARVRKNSFLAI